MSMSDDNRISEEEIEHLAELARLSLSEDEVTEFRTKLDDLLAHCEQLSDVPAVDDDATLTNVFAPSEEETTLDRDAATQNAETTEDGAFRGPAVGDGT